MEYDKDDLDNLIMNKFRPITTVKYAVLQILLIIAFLVLAVVLNVHDESKYLSGLDVYKVLAFAQAGFWLLSVILKSIYEWRHKFVRLDGHFEFFTKIERISSTLFNEISLATALLVVTFGALIPTYIEPSSKALPPAVIFLLFVIVETLMILPVIVVYIFNVVRFNRAQPFPDVDKMTCWAPQDPVSASAVGYRNVGEEIALLLQKQAFLISYYKEKNEYLCTKLMQVAASSARDEFA